MLLFVDTEFADVQARELVSLALVSEDGEFEFYAERDPLPSSPTEFVRSVVYPLLNRGARALTDEKFTRELTQFLARVAAVSGCGKLSVAYDFRADIHLLDYALDGFTSYAATTHPAIRVMDLGLLGSEYCLAVEDIFAKNQEIAARRHHALVDARVNRDAYELVRRPSWGAIQNESCLARQKRSAGVGAPWRKSFCRLHRADCAVDPLER